MKYTILLIAATISLYSCHRSKNHVGGPVLSSVPIEDTHWALIEIMGKPVHPKQIQKPISLLLSKANQRVTGSSGCNHYNGSYALDEAIQRISFQKIATTMMACKDMETERSFLKLLEETDHYAISGDTLSLQRAKVAPLARFIAVKQ
jgi:heat shock protein HslJ